MKPLKKDVLERQKFHIYRSIYETFNAIPDREDRLDFITAILNYSFDFKEPELDGMLEALWRSNRVLLFNDIQRFKAGKLGGKKSGETRRDKAPKKPSKNTPKEITSSTDNSGADKFLTWFNEMLLAHTGTKGKFRTLDSESKVNFLELKQAYDSNQKDFENAFISMIQDHWPKEKNLRNPKHFLKPDNFQKYLNAEHKDPDRFKAPWEK